MAEPEQTEDLVDELESVINRNLAEDGRLDAYKVPGAEPDPEDDVDSDDEGDDQLEDEEEVEGPEPLDLDSDFDWNSFAEMKPSHRRWPQHDTSVVWQPSAINRYMTDYLSLVARVEKVSTVLSRVHIAVTATENDIDDANVYAKHVAEGIDSLRTNLSRYLEDGFDDIDIRVTRQLYRIIRKDWSNLETAMAKLK